MEDKAAILRELREMILRRPGMYFGGDDAPLCSWLGHCMLDALQAGARKFSVISGKSGEVQVRCEGAAFDSTWQNLLAATSVRFEEQINDGDMLLRFEPDLATFPNLDFRESRRLVSVLRDAATAFPVAQIEFVDERADIHLRLHYPHGSNDRLLEEAGLRTLGPRFVFRGAADGVSYDVALAWGNGPGLQVVALTNGRRNANGGSHIYGVWEGVAVALESRLASEGATNVRCRPEDLPRNALLVVSVHVESPEFGPATRDCLHHRESREAIREAVARSFFSELGESLACGNKPPWQMLGAVHLNTPWLERLPAELSEAASDAQPFVDPYAHREDHGDAELATSDPE